MEEYLWREEYWEANDLDDTRLEEYEIHVYDKAEKALVNCREGREGEGGLRRKTRM